MAGERGSRGSHRIARTLLVIGCLSGLGIYLTTPFAAPDQLMLASDVYQLAAERMLAGESLYRVAPTDRPGYFYLYPPIVTVLFIPHALVGSGLAAFGLQTVLNLGAAVGTALLIDRLLRRRDIATADRDRALLIAFFLLSSYSAIQFINGQVNLWLALAFGVAFDALDRRRQVLAGTAFGIAALIKVFPAIMGVWLLRQRAWRGVAAAVVTGLAGLSLGVVAFGPELTETYVTEVLLARFEDSTYHTRPRADAGVDGIHRQLAAVWPDGTRWHTPVGLVLIGGLLAGAVRRVETRRQRDVAGLATITAILLFLPVQPLYFPLLAVPLLLLLYDLPTGWTRWLVGGGAAMTMIHINQPSVDFLVSMLPLPTAVGEAIVTTTAAVFRVVLPPTIGMWAILVGCLAFQWGQPGTRGPTTEAQGSTEAVGND